MPGGEHVPQQEDQDPDRDRVEERPHTRHRVLDPTDGQTQEDREAGDGAEQDDFRAAHG